MIAAPGFGIALPGWKCSVLSDESEALEFLARYLVPWLPRTAPAAHAGAVFRVVRNPGGGFDAFLDSHPIATRDSLAAILYQLQYAADEAAVERLTDATAVHAGAVAFGGSVLLLPGASQAGKSTLVTELLRRGAVYYSDEYALVDDRGLVHPYPRSLNVRDAAGRGRPALAGEFGARTGTDPAPVGWILLLERQAGAAWQLHPQAQSDAVIALLSNTPHLLSDRPGMFDRLRRAAAGAACFAGVRGEADAAASRILEIVAECR